jgi:glutamate N-acetyltransferase / amino-acid N-acetyltransferase
MLAYFMTDLAVSAKVLQPILNRVVEATFNRITVDGDMSTNDTALILANGKTGNPPLKAGSKEAKDFEKNLTEVALKLALQMVEDGEGATKVVELVVKGAKNQAVAREIAYRVGRSQLVKTSFFGQDPNWGRLLAAIGYSGAPFDPSKVDIYYGPVKAAAGGIATTPEADRQAHEVMTNKHFTVTLDLKMGKGSFRIWTSDLTTDYVKLNAEYRT